jgi:NAD+ kinase
LYTILIKVLFIKDCNMIVYIEEADYEDDNVNSDDRIKAAKLPMNGQEKPSLRMFCSVVIGESYDKAPCVRDKIDFIICLGGDGTLLHVSTLFQKSCPPVLSIHLGSLGFLCPFDYENYKEYVNATIKGNVPLLLRTRLKCKLERKPLNSLTASVESSTQNLADDTNQDDTILIPPPANKDEWLSLNEIVVGRGPSSYLCNLDLYINDYLVTTVQGDGLIISTPTGSTAYAMAAGASMCHPSVPAIIIAPICPHSLSFRPIVVPAGIDLHISLGSDSRSTAWYSVDGRNTSELLPGYRLKITNTEYPLPTISRSDQINDWFEGSNTF